MPPSFFTRTTGGLTPTDLPMSPWSPGALNGIAIGGLLATLLEEMAPEPPASMALARVTIDLLGLVPAIELQPRFTLLRDGRRMQMLQVELLAEGRAAARLQALRVRRADTPAARTVLDYPSPEDLPPLPRKSLGVLRHADQREIAGRRRKEGPGVQWVRFDYEVIGGTPLTPLARTAMAADYLAARGNMVGAEPYTWPNLDISLFMMREPAGDWLLIEAEMESDGDGHAIASGRLADREGVFARAHQVTFIERFTRDA